MRHSRHFLFLSLKKGLIVIATLVFQCCLLPAGNKPNIILIFADDAGFADFGFQGSKYFKTPHIDVLASQSVIATQAYVSASVCGPSRAGLLTGINQARFGFYGNNTSSSANATRHLELEDLGLPLDQNTIADYLKDLGYVTAIIGKWHMGNADRFHPLQRGFDYFYGMREGARSYWAYDKPEEEPYKRLERNFKQFREHGGYLTDRFADEAVNFIEGHSDSPFFLYLSFNAVHTPMDAREEDINVFPELTGKRSILAAMTLAMDRAVGRVLAALGEANLANNTIVVFTNDNGGPTHSNASSNYPLRGVKGTELEGGIRVPFLVRWPNRLPKGVKYEMPVSTLDLLPTFIKAGGGNLDELPQLDGVDLIPYLTGEKVTRPHQTLYWVYSYQRAAIRDGDWKLLRLMDRPAELYNIAEDTSESKNLADRYPEKVRELYKKLFTWETQNQEPLFNTGMQWRSHSMELYDTYK